MNRTRGFVNLNRFKSSKSIKQLNKTGYVRKKDEAKKNTHDIKINCNFGA